MSTQLNPWTFLSRKSFKLHLFTMSTSLGEQDTWLQSQLNSRLALWPWANHCPVWVSISPQIYSESIIFLSPSPQTIIKALSGVKSCPSRWFPGQFSPPIPALCRVGLIFFFYVNSFTFFFSYNVPRATLCTNNKIQIPYRGLHNLVSTTEVCQFLIHTQSFPISILLKAFAACFSLCMKHSPQPALPLSFPLTLPPPTHTHLMYFPWF